MNRVDQFIADNGGTAVDAIANHGLPEGWGFHEVFDLLARMAKEMAKAEQERRKQ